MGNLLAFLTLIRRIVINPVVYSPVRLMFEQLRQTRFPVRCPLNKVKGGFKKEIARTCEVDTIDIKGRGYTSIN